MARINRYTQLTPARYTPRTLQETLMAPSIMRAQHDKADQDMLQYASLLQQADVLPNHIEEMQMIKSGLEQQLDNYAGQLLEEGFSPGIKNNLLKFNRTYQDVYGPTGRIGQMEAAKKAFMDEYKRILESDEMKDYGSDVVLNKWAEHVKNYTGYNPLTNDITTIEGMRMPKYEDFNKYLSEVFDDLGEDVWTDYATANWSVEEDPYTGAFVVVDRHGKKVTSDNANAILSAVERARDYWVNGGPGTNVAQFMNWTPEFVNKQILDTANSKRNTKVDVDNKVRTGSLLHNPFDIGGGENPEGDLYGAPRELQNPYGDLSASDLRSRYENLRNSSNLEDQAEADVIEGLLAEVDSYVKGNEEYQEGLEKYESSVNIINEKLDQLGITLPNEDKERLLRTISSHKKGMANEHLLWVSTLYDKGKVTKEQYNELLDFVKKTKRDSNIDLSFIETKRRLENEYLQDKKYEAMFYTVPATVVSGNDWKQNSRQILTEVAPALANNNLFQIVSWQSSDVAGKEILHHNKGQEQKDALAKALSEANAQGKANITGWLLDGSGEGGKPMFEIEFTPVKKVTISKGENLSEGTPVKIRVSFDNLSPYIEGVKPIERGITELLEKHGGEAGKKLVSDFKKSTSYKYVPVYEDTSKNNFNTSSRDEFTRQHMPYFNNANSIKGLNVYRSRSEEGRVSYKIQVKDDNASEPYTLTVGDLINLSETGVRNTPAIDTLLYTYFQQTLNDPEFLRSIEEEVKVISDPKVAEDFITEKAYDWMREVYNDAEVEQYNKNYLIDMFNF